MLAHQRRSRWTTRTAHSTRPYLDITTIDSANPSDQRTRPGAATFIQSSSNDGHTRHPPPLRTECSDRRSKARGASTAVSGEPSLTPPSPPEAHLVPRGRAPAARHSRALTNRGNPAPRSSRIIGARLVELGLVTDNPQDRPKQAAVADIDSWPTSTCPTASTASSAGTTGMSRCRRDSRITAALRRLIWRAASLALSIYPSAPRRQESAARSRPMIGHPPASRAGGDRSCAVPSMVACR